MEVGTFKLACLLMPVMVGGVTANPPTSVEVRAEIVKFASRLQQQFLDPALQQQLNGGTAQPGQPGSNPAAPGAAGNPANTPPGTTTPGGAPQPVNLQGQNLFSLKKIMEAAKAVYAGIVRGMMREYADLNEWMAHKPHLQEYFKSSTAYDMSQLEKHAEESGAIPKKNQTGTQTPGGTQQGQNGQQNGAQQTPNATQGQQPSASPAQSSQAAALQPTAMTGGSADGGSESGDGRARELKERLHSLDHEINRLRRRGSSRARRALRAKLRQRASLKRRLQSMRGR